MASGCWSWFLLVPSSEVLLVSGQADDRRFPISASIAAKGSLLVLKSRAPGPIRTAYVLVINRIHNAARIVLRA